jgi:hypothetical protein
MELARQEENKQSTAVEKVSQNAIVQTLAIKEFKKTSEALPKRIQGTFELPKVREMVLAVGEKTVAGFIEFELIKLAERINASGNLTDGQVEFIATQLAGLYPNETIADFKICFEKGASGAYGKIFKLDGVEIGNWMKSYLDEKYTVLEGELMKEKDNVWEKAKTNTDWLKLWQESIQKTDEEGGVKNTSRNLFMIANARGMAKRDILEVGKPNPAPLEPYPSTPLSYQEKINATVRKGREIHFREKYPGATDEQVTDFLNSFEDGK